MTASPRTLSASSALAALALLAACSSAAGEQPARAGAAVTARTDAATGPIVVELFTSQGCSSCPPADRVLSRLVHDGKVGERAVVPLAFHVDYWNDLGWADPFSRAAWSDRQRSYGAAFGDGRIYTPQLVVGGRAHVLGSDAAAIRARVAATPAPALLDATITWSARTATVSATAPAGADVYVAIYEDDVTTAVSRGENAGASLRNDHIVRRLERVAAAGHDGKVEVALDPSWQHLGAVAIAQGRDRVITASRALARR